MEGTATYRLGIPCAHDNPIVMSLPPSNPAAEARAAAIASRRVDGSLSQAVVEFVAGAAQQTLPPDTLHLARRLVLNWLGCALGAAGDPSVDAAFGVAHRLGASRAASVVGRPDRLDVVNASLVNGIAANALDYDDMHVPTLIHPTGAVVASALALAEQAHVDGTRFLHAVAAGIEVECRLGQLLFPHHYDHGWHISATLGTIGAAAAGCVVLGLDAGRTAHALGLASTQAGGLRAMLDNPCKSFNIGKAAAAGTLSVLMAQAGFDSQPMPLEARFGLFDVFGWPEDPQAGHGVLRRAGAPWILDQVSLKPYPCGVVIHPVIDACLAIARSPGFDPSCIVRLTVAVHPRTLVLAGRQHPDCPITGRFSLFHAAALALARRTAGLAAFDGTPVDDPDLRALRDRMHAVADAGRSPGSCHVQIRMADGTIVERTVDAPSGSPANPLTDGQLEAKFIELARRAMDARSAAAMYVTCMQMERAPDMAMLATHWAAAPAPTHEER